MASETLPVGYHSLGETPSIYVENDTTLCTKLLLVSSASTQKERYKSFYAVDINGRDCYCAVGGCKKPHYRVYPNDMKCIISHLRSNHCHLLHPVDRTEGTATTTTAVLVTMRRRRNTSGTLLEQ